MNLSLPETIEKLYESELPILTFQAKEKYSNGKAIYLLDEEYLSVEKFVSELLKRNGFESISGVNFRRAFEYLNFSQEKSARFDELIQSLESDKQFGKTIHGKRIQDLKSLKKKILGYKSKLSEQPELVYQLIDLASSLHKEMRVSLSSIVENEATCFEIIKNLDKHGIIKLMGFFDHINGLIRGTPDLFVFSKNEFYFVEVKSDKDSLSKWQICFIHYFRKMVGDNIKVLHIVNENW